MSAAENLVVTLTSEQMSELVAKSVEGVVERIVASQQKEVMTLAECAAFLGRNEEVVVRVLVKKKGLPVHYISEREPRFRRAEVLDWLATLPSKPGKVSGG